MGLYLTTGRILALRALAHTLLLYTAAGCRPNEARVQPCMKAESAPYHKPARTDKTTHTPNVSELVLVHSWPQCDEVIMAFGKALWRGCLYVHQCAGRPVTTAYLPLQSL